MRKILFVCCWPFIANFLILPSAATAKNGAYELSLPNKSDLFVLANDSAGNSDKGNADQKLCMLADERSAFYLSVPESAPKGSVLGVLPVNGVSDGPNATIRLRVVQGREWVRLGPNGGKQLMLHKELDREQGMSRFGTVVECVPLTASTSGGTLFPVLNISIFVAVTDVNDNAPQFPRGGQFSIRIPEELPEGTPIRLEFGAIDRDQSGPNSHIRYRIVRSDLRGEGGSWAEEEDTMPNSEETSTFAVSQSNEDSSDFSLLTIPDPDRPELVVSGRIDFERIQQFTVHIEAEDQGRPKLRTRARLEVIVEDVDDQNPVIAEEVYTSREAKSGQLIIEPGPIRAWDADRSLNESIIFSVAGEHSINYSIDEQSGAVQLLADELMPAKLIIRASQLNRPERKATSILIVEPNKKAKTVDEIIILKIPSNVESGTVLMDLGENVKNGERRSQQQQQQPGSIVYLDNKANSLKLSRQLASGEYNVTLPIFLRNSSSSSPSSMHIRLTVFDPPVGGGDLQFDKSTYEFRIDRQRRAEMKGEEGQEGARMVRVGQVWARHHRKRMGDEKRNENSGRTNDQQQDRSAEEPIGPIRYSMLNGNSSFHIDPVRGVLHLLRNSSASPPAFNELVVLAQDPLGHHAFARCLVRFVPSAPADVASQLFPLSSPSGDDLSPAVLSLGLLCFLLLVSNCATLSLWLGKRRFSSIYEQLARRRYDSIDGITTLSYGTPPSSSILYQKRDHRWMMNRGLECDRGVTIEKIGEEWARGGEKLVSPGMGTESPRASSTPTPKTPNNDNTTLSTFCGVNGRY